MLADVRKRGHTWSTSLENLRGKMEKAEMSYIVSGIMNSAIRVDRSGVYGRLERCLTVAMQSGPKLITRAWSVPCGHKMSGKT